MQTAHSISTAAIIKSKASLSRPTCHKTTCFYATRICPLLFFATLLVLSHPLISNNPSSPSPTPKKNVNANSSQSLQHPRTLGNNPPRLYAPRSRTMSVSVSSLCASLHTYPLAHHLSPTGPPTLLVLDIPRGAGGLAEERALCPGDSGEEL
jgi:hypothetical protein